MSEQVTSRGLTDTELALFESDWEFAHTTSDHGEAIVAREFIPRLITAFRAECAKSRELEASYVSVLTELEAAKARFAPAFALLVRWKTLDVSPHNSLGYNDLCEATRNFLRVYQTAGEPFLDELRAAREVVEAAKEYLDYVRRGEGGFGLLTATEVTRHQSGRYSAQREALMDALAHYEKAVQRSGGRDKG